MCRNTNSKKHLKDVEWESKYHVSVGRAGRRGGKAEAAAGHFTLSHTLGKPR